MKIDELRFSAGNAVRMTTDEIELLVSIEFGPRILHVSRPGMPNLLQMPDSAGQPGGHSMYFLPERKNRNFQQDDVPVKWKREEDGVRFNAPVDQKSKLQPQLIVSREGQDSVKIIHRLYNHTAWPIEYSIVARGFMAGRGIAVVPAAAQNFGTSCAVASIALWPGATLGSEGAKIQDNFLFMQSGLKDAEDEDNRIGLYNPEAWIAWKSEGQVLYRRFADAPGLYPNFNSRCSVHAFHGNLILESFSPLAKVEPDSYLSHEEIWTVKVSEDVKGGYGFIL